MTKIEERAMMFAEFVLHEVQKATYNECVDIVNEKDRIARKEERERCIKAAQDAHCGMCPLYEVCHNLSGGNLDGECNAKANIRKAIEEGGDHGKD